MAQTGFTPIQLYSSSTATNVPLAANLATGELAINITDGKLFYKDNAAAVQVIGWKVVPATAGGTGQTSYAVGDLLYANTTTTLAKLPDVATGNALISGGVGVAPSYGKIGLTTHVSGTLPTANGGTNLTSFTANGLVYASSTSALATGSAITFDGTNFATTGTATATRFIPTGSTVATNGLYLPAANSIGISTNSTNAIYIDSSRNVMIGTTTAFAAGGLSFDRSNNSNFIRIVQNSLVDGATHQSFQTNGTQNGYIAVSAGVTIYSTTSDYRMKENVAKMTGALDKVALLNPVTFDWVDSKKSCQGFIAHELQAVVPECVFGTKDAVDEEGKPVLQGVDTSFLVATLTAAIQELKAEFDDYKAAHP